ESLFFNSYVVEDAAKAKPATDIFNNNNGGKENMLGLFFDTTPSKYRNPDGTITKGGLLVAIVNQNLYTIEGETTPSGKVEGFDKSMSGEEVRKAWNDWNSNLKLSKNVVQGSGIIDMDATTNQNYKDPISEMFEDMEKFQKEQLERLEKQRKAKRLAEQRKVDIKV
ncbi:hypothetical protein CQA76_07795, partial [Campylobacter aviculae]